MTKTKSQTSLTNITLLMVATRLIESTIVQLFYPFLPIIAAGINISEIQMGQLLGLQSSTSLLAPLFGATADKRGYRRLIQFCLLLTTVGCVIIYLSESLPLFTVGLLIQGIGLSGSSPLVAAYLSNILPFEQRSRGLSFLEYSWALAGIVMMPLIGWLIDGTSWRTPFLLLGILQAATILGFAYLPSIHNKSASPDAPPQPWSTRLRDFFDLGANWRSAVATLSIDALIKFSGLTISFTFGLWLIETYGLDASGLGQVALLLGGADICGSILVSVIGDRLGKRRSVISGTLVGLVFYLLLPWWEWSLTGALIGLFLIRWSFEFTFVASLVFISEQSPHQRGKMMSLRVGIGFIATLLASFAGPVLYAQFGISGVTVPGSIGMALAGLVAWLLAVERGEL